MFIVQNREFRYCIKTLIMVNFQSNKNQNSKRCVINQFYLLILLCLLVYFVSTSFPTTKQWLAGQILNSIRQTLQLPRFRWYLRLGFLCETKLNLDQNFRRRTSLLGQIIRAQCRFLFTDIAVTNRVNFSKKWCTCLILSWDFL